MVTLIKTASVLCRLFNLFNLLTYLLSVLGTTTVGETVNSLVLCI